MDGTRWNRVKEIVQRAEELPRVEADAYIVTACAGDQRMVDEVRSLLKYATVDRDDETEVLRVRPGTVLDRRYRVAKYLSQGGFGVTWLAEDLQLHDRPCVIKIPTRLDPADPWLARKFQSEIAALSGLSHPGIVSPRGSGVLADGTPFLVMDFVEGSTLREVIRSGRLTPGRVASIIQQMSRALQALQAKNVYHRDLKPDNVMVQSLPDGTDYVRLIDFGIASMLGNRGGGPVATRVVGTPSYMAPEQLRGEVGPTTDVYAFALIAREMMTQLVTDGRRDAPTVRDSTLSSSSALPAHWTAPLAAALVADPQKRRSDVAALGDELATALTARAAMPDPAPKSRRRPLLIAATMVTLAVAAWVVAGSDVGSDPAPTTTQPATAVSTTSVPAREPAPVPREVSIELIRKAQPRVRWPVTQLPVVLRSDDQFRLRISSSATGHLYLFGEGSDGSLHVLFPSTTANGGSSVVLERQTIQVPEKTWLFTESPSENRLWLVWSHDPQGLMEQVRSVANPADEGVIASAEQRRQILGFLTAADNRTGLDDGRILVSGANGIVVGVIGIRHAP